MLKRKPCCLINEKIKMKFNMRNRNTNEERRNYDLHTKISRLRSSAQLK